VTDASDPGAVSLSWLRGKPGAKWARPGPDVLAAWVADMDFAPAPAIRDRLQAVIDSGDLGYPNWEPLGCSPLRELLVERMARRHDWQIGAGEVRELCDVMQGVQAALHAHTAPGDGVVLHTPAYPPFLAGFAHMGRRIVEVPAQRTGAGWSFDHGALAATLRRDPGVRTILLCNPHNPTGHVFTDAELSELAELAERHDLLIVSDEIHGELVYPPHRHRPIAALGDDVARRTVTVTSASKAFNLAGLRWAAMHVGHRPTLEALDRLPPHLLGAPNVMAVAATMAAWTDGDPWLAGILGLLDRNRRHLVERLTAEVPGLDVAAPDATYLAWLDCRALALPDEPYVVVRRAGVELSPGRAFGVTGAGFVRLNFATSPEVLDAVIDRVAGALAGTGDH